MAEWFGSWNPKMQNDIILAAPEESTRRIERFQSLSPGQYWRALRDDAEQGVEQGEVLLIESLLWVEEAVHTVVLRAHPSKYGKRVEVLGHKHWRLEQHRFLLNDFLTAFEFEQQAAQVRALEIQAIQSRVQDLQGELMTAQRDPALLQSVIQEELQKQASEGEQGGQDGENQTESPKASEEPERKEGGQDKADAGGDAAVSATSGTSLLAPGAASQVGALGAITLGQAVSAGLSEQGVVELRAAAEREHQIATIKAQWIQGKTQAISETIQAMTPFFEEQAAAALASTQGVRTYVADLLRGIESLDLYVGNGVHVQTLREGAHAARDVPLTFMQAKLAIDEELAIWADLDERFDVEGDELFVKALREHDELVQQIFPTERCIVVMATTAREIDYGHPMASEKMREENRKVFLLVRDGWNIHRVYSSVESHLKSARLFPSKDEHERIFRGFDGTKIGLEDLTYADRMAEHELFALHYKRFLILACGLDHRLKLFGDFYDGPPSMDFLSMSFQERNCRFLYDDDASMMLPGQQGRPELRAWIDAKNAFLASGSRVLCHWPSLMNPNTAPGACLYRGSSYGGFSWRARPQRSAEIVIAYRDKHDLCVDTMVSTGGRGARDTFQARVMVNKYRRGEWGGSELMPFLCLDDVSAEELEWFIHDRKARKHQIEYIRLFKMGLRFLRKEVEQEAGARAKLLDAVRAGGLAEDDQQAQGLIDQAVRAWRASQRGRSLPSLDNLSDPAEQRAWKSLLDQMYVMAGKLTMDFDAVAQFATGQGLMPIQVALSGKAKTVVYAAPSSDELDERLQPFSWVHRITFEIAKRGPSKLREVSRTWARLSLNVASEQVQHVFDEALQAHWVERAKGKAFSTPKAKKEFFDRIERWEDLAEDWSKPLDDDEWRRRAHKFDAERAAMSKTRVNNPVIAIAIGAMLYRGAASYITVQAPVMPMLARLNPSREREAWEVHADIYMTKDATKGWFKECVRAEGAPWRLSMHEAISNATVYQDTGFWPSGLSHETLDPLLQTAVDDFKEEFSKVQVVWAHGLFEDSGACRLDAALGVRRPHDYQPTHTRYLQMDSLGLIVFDMAGNGVDLDKICPREDLAKELGAHGWSSSGQSFINEELAVQSMRRMAQGLECKSLASAQEEAEFPQPPEGVKRWVGRFAAKAAPF